MYDHIFLYIETFLSPYLFGYRKGHSTQQCLLVMVEMWRNAIDSKKVAEGQSHRFIDSKKVAGAILADLSKALDCLSHDLLIAKFDAYGFDKSALKFIYDFLKSRTQRTRVTDCYSSWK